VLCCTRSLVCIVRAHTSRHHRSAATNDIPCAMVLTLIDALSPVSMTLLVTVACKSSFADLAPAQGCQDHTPSPSAFMPLVAQHDPRPSHPALNVRDDAYAPLSSAGRRQWSIDLRKTEAEFFDFPTDARLRIETALEFRCFAQAFFAPSGAVAPVATSKKRADFTCRANHSRRHSGAARKG
jgi:hypothetical protein